MAAPAPEPSTKKQESSEEPRLWYLNPVIENRYLENKTDPPEYLTYEQLYLETQVVHGRIEVDPKDEEGTLKKAQKIRNMPSYVLVEMDISKEKDKFEEHCDMIWKHHIHIGSDVLRIGISGTGWYDIQDLNGRWIRCRWEPGDWFTFPDGCYHRATTDMNKKLKAYMMQYDKKAFESHHWPEAEKEPTRIQYIEKLKSMRRDLKFPWKAMPGSLDAGTS